jgi:radical SAM superfamily enzyme YgiQ (UPF0313 family)
LRNILLGSFSVLYNDWLPYASGCLISHCKKIPEITQKYIFLEPLYKQKPVEEYYSELMNADILGLTCYVWNQSYNDEMAKYFKTIKPMGIVVYGGPQVPEDVKLKKEYDDLSPSDYSIAGLGEIAFSEWLLGLPLSGKKLTDMPTPYLDGTFDALLSTDEKFKVSFETNRGCPYGCSFCDWGGQARSKVTFFDTQDVKNTIDYIYQHDNIVELEILDANFGIVAMDVEYIDFMISCQEKYNNKLKISYSGLAKNGSKHLPIVLSKVFDHFPIDQRNLKISFQSHTKEVLDVVNRSNIDNSKLIPLIQEFKAKNIPTTSEMIIGLPGETADSWLKTLHYNYHDLGIDFIRTYILHVVANTPLYEQSYRNKWKIKTKKVGYNNNVVEVVNECYSYDLTEILKMFDYWWFYSTFVNTNLLKGHIKDLYFETKTFVDNIDKMPFLKSCLDQYRQIVELIFREESFTQLNNKMEMRFLGASLKGKEVDMIIKNPIAAMTDINMFYKDITTNWKCDNPYDVISIIN